MPLSDCVDSHSSGLKRGCGRWTDRDQSSLLRHNRDVSRKFRRARGAEKQHRVEAGVLEQRSNRLAIRHSAIGLDTMHAVPGGLERVLHDVTREMRDGQHRARGPNRTAQLRQQCLSETTTRVLVLGHEVYVQPPAAQRSCGRWPHCSDLARLFISARRSAGGTNERLDPVRARDDEPFILAPVPSLGSFEQRTLIAGWRDVEERARHGMGSELDQVREELSTVGGGSAHEHSAARKGTVARHLEPLSGASRSAPLASSASHTR